MNNTELEDYIKKSYLSYSCMVLSGRQLCYIQDGLKPVHRRILFAMSKLSMSSTSAYKKSARVVGDVIGKYHPHGDSSVYDAMVRMSQPWSMRYPLVDGQGNFGSRDGDGAAAMRYTEVRTTPLADMMLSELNSGAIDFIPNYDSTMKEPEFLPGPLPIGLLNGSTGIAVGMAADIPSHNARETADAVIAYIRNNNITVDEIMEHLKGPDLPVGGQIIDSREHINKCYEKGYGQIHVRARWEVEKLSRGQWRVNVFEMPPGMSPAKIIKKVADAEVYEPPKDPKTGKAKPNKAMVELKQFVKSSIDDIRDVTSSDDPPGSARMIIEPKSSRQDPEEFMESIVAQLGLQSTLKFNLIAVSLDKYPRRRSIIDIIKDWVEFRRATVTKRTQTRLGKVNDRLELIEGRLSIMDVLDEVIEIIRTDDEPRDALMARFDLSERQADDILEIRLKELRKLETYKLKEEQDKLVKEKAELEGLLASTRKMNNLIIREINAATDKFNDERRTLIEEAEEITKSTVSVTPSEPVTLWLTKDNWVIGRKGHLPEEDAPESSLKPGDKFVLHLQTKLDKTLLLLSDTGRSYSIDVALISFGRGNGTHLNTLISLSGGRIVWCDTYEEGKKYLLGHTEAHGFIVKSESLLTKPKAGKECFKLDKTPNASISCILPLDDDKPMLNIWTDKGRMLQFNVGEINEYPKSSGMRLANLASDELALGYAFSSEGEFIYKGRRKTLDDSYLKKRAAAPKKVK